jgi:transcriptional antiterminator NusG
MKNTEWYVLQVYANSELAVKRAIENQQEAQGFFENIEEIFVPIREVTSISPKGKKTLLQKALFPGYIYLNISNYDRKQMSDLNKIPKASQMLGTISDQEIDILKGKVEEEAGKIHYRVSFENGQKVLIKSGAFENFTGTVEEFEAEKNIVKVFVEIFGRSQEVELPIADVEPVEE